MIYFSSDTHWGHLNIIKYCNRPFNDAEEMDKEMTRRWNEIVSQEDTVYFLGDFSLNKAETLEPTLSTLNGNKHLIIGNHDGSIARHKKLSWKSVQEELYIEDPQTGLVAWLNHYPYSSEPPFNSKHARPKATHNWDIALCGHVHNAWIINKFNCINVGCDVWDFYPQTLHEMIKKTGWSGKIEI